MPVMVRHKLISHFYSFFSETPATPPSFTLSLHDALPISPRRNEQSRWNAGKDLSFVPLRPERVVEVRYDYMEGVRFRHTTQRSEEHTSELQSLAYLVCRLLLEKKKRQLVLH